MSLPRKKVYERIEWGLNRQFTDPKMTWLKNLAAYLWREIIFDDPIDHVRVRGSGLDWEGLPSNKSLFNQPPGRGIVIGNLSSQLISNIYLDQLDRFITMELGYKYYGRYVDDFYFIVPEEELDQAKTDLVKIKDFLISIDLTLHPHKSYIQEVHHGVKFLGYVVYPYAIHPGKRLKRNFSKAMAEMVRGERTPNSAPSYLGYLMHVKGKKVAHDVLESIGCDYRY